MKKLYNVSILLGFYLVFGLCQVQAQNMNSIKCRYNQDNQKYFIKYIDFINNTTKVKETTFDIPKHNPYNRLNFSILSQKNDQNNQYYKINHIKIKDFSLPKGKFKFRKDLADTSMIINSFATSYSGVFTSDTSHIIVLYKFIMYQDDVFMGMSSTVYILSNDGTILHIFNEFDTECLTPTVTMDGKFFAYGYGGGNDEDGNSLDEVGFSIINLNNQEMIVDEKLGDQYNAALPHNFGNLIRVNCKRNNSRTYIVYDFDKKRRYTKTYPFQDIVFMKEVTKDSFVFEEKDRSGKYWIDNFEESFEIQEIK